MSSIKKNINPATSKNNECINLKEDLKHFGYLLPTNDEELEDFHKINGSTKVIVPEKFKNGDFLFKKKEISNSKVVSLVNSEIVKSKANKHNVSKTVYFKKVVLAAEIANKLHGEPTFGHVKFVKLLYLCEQVCNMQLATNYGKYAAGPLDPKLIHSIDAEFKKKKWFKVFKNDKGYKYEPDEKLGEYEKYYSNYFHEELNSINMILSLFQKLKTNFCEIVATAYAVWKELIDEQLHISDEIIIKKFYAWHTEKQKFTELQIRSALKWMNDNKIVPVTS